jgi:hypothetical protein
VSDRPCPLDGTALAPGAVICGGCHAALRYRLRDVPGLLAELDVTATGLRSTWREPGPKGGSGEPSRFDQAAHDAAVGLRTVLHGWVRVWHEETPVVPERRPAVDLLLSTAAGQAALLASQQLGHRPWVAELAIELNSAVKAARRAVDTPQPMAFVCACTCGSEVLSPLDATIATCRDCGERWDVVISRAMLLEIATRDIAAPAAVIARTLGPSLVTAAMIRGWRHRGVLDVDHINAAGQPCYNVAAVSKLAREGAPTRDPKQPDQRSG